MTISIDWGTRVISIPKSFLTLISGTSYSLDTNAFHIALKDLEDDEGGMPFPPTHSHNTAVTLGGIQYARIIEMINGYTITFEDGVYSVSLIGSNNNILDVTNLNQVSIRANNSAGLINVVELQQDIFGGEVTVDAANGYAGTLYPVGTPLRPVNNIPEARQIAEARGFSTIRVIGSLTLTTGDDVSGFRVIGENAARTMIVAMAGADTAGVEIRESVVTGTLDGTAILRQCYVFDLIHISGFIFECQLAGTITLGGVMPAAIMNCFAAANGVVIDMNGSGHSLNMSGWSGDVTIANKTGTDSCNLHVSAASVIIAASVTNGVGIHVDGVGEFRNESSITPEHVEILGLSSIADEVWSQTPSSMPAGGIGEWLFKKVLSVPKYLGLK